MKTIVEKKLNKKQSERVHSPSAKRKTCLALSPVVFQSFEAQTNKAGIKKALFNDKLINPIRSKVMHLGTLTRVGQLSHLTPLKAGASA